MAALPRYRGGTPLRAHRPGTTALHAGRSAAAEEGALAHTGGREAPRTPAVEAGTEAAAGEASEPITSSLSPPSVQFQSINKVIP